MDDLPHKVSACKYIHVSTQKMKETSFALSLKGVIELVCLLDDS